MPMSENSRWCGEAPPHPNHTYTFTPNGIGSTNLEEFAKMVITEGSYLMSYLPILRLKEKLVSSVEVITR